MIPTRANAARSTTPGPQIVRGVLSGRCKGEHTHACCGKRIALEDIALPRLVPHSAAHPRQCLTVLALDNVNLALLGEDSTGAQAAVGERLELDRPGWAPANRFQGIQGELLFHRRHAFG